MPIVNDNINLVGNFDAQSVEINFCETLMFICMQKINFIFKTFFRYCKGYCKLAILGTLVMLDYPHQNHTINLKQAFMLIRVEKINFTTKFYLKILQRNDKLVILGNLGMPDHKHVK